jgi:4-hydroxybenzoate polyprenyltransferase
VSVSPSIVAQGPRGAGAGRPLVIDVERALLKTNLFLEALLALLSVSPMAVLRALMRLPAGRGAFEAAIFAQTGLAVDTLPLDEGVAGLARDAAAQGRPVVLASGAREDQIRVLAGRLGLEPRLLDAAPGLRLTPARRRAAAGEAFGEDGFDYVGAPPAGPARGRWRALVRALRCHQWAKNLLIFAPALGAHQFGDGLLYSLVAFFSFSLCASSVYLTNDLLDLGADRAHPRKHTRPMAAGTLPIGAALAAAVLLLAGAAALAALLPPRFLMVLAGYYLLTLAYSFALKKHAIIDVMALACLYGARLAAGSAATGAPLSPWLEALSTFLFLSLALVKRSTELVDRKDETDRFTRRGYWPSDLPLLLNLAAASGYLSALVFALYVNSQDVGRLYAHPHRLWLVCIVILYWISAILLKTHRGEMHDDPVVFAFKDRTSRLCGVAAAAIVASAIL